MSESPEPEWRRLHPLSPIMKGGLFFLVVVGIILANLRDHIVAIVIPGIFGERIAERRGNSDLLLDGRFLLMVLLGVVAVVAVIVGLTWLSWHFHTFRITAEVVETRRGVLFRQHRRAPLERIQSVNLQRSLLARMLGLTKIDVQTAGQGGKVELAYLSHRDAKLVRDEILRTVEALAPAADPLLGSDSLSGGGSLPDVSVSDRLSVHLDTVVDEDLITESEIAGKTVHVNTGRLLASTFFTHEALVMLLVTLGIVASAVVVGWMMLAILIPGLIALVGVVFSRFNLGFRFAISGSSEAVRTGSGLTMTMTETIPLRRIHAVDILQPLGWRIFGWWRIRVTTTSNKLSTSNNSQSMFQNILLPVGKMDDVERVMNLIGYGFETLTAELADDGSAYTRSPKRAFPVLLLGLRRSGVRIVPHEVTGTQMRIRRGFVTRHLVIVPLERSQSVAIARPLVHRLFGLAVLQAHTVPGAVGTGVRGLDLREAEREFTRARLAACVRDAEIEEL